MSKIVGVVIFLVVGLALVLPHLIGPGKTDVPWLLEDLKKSDANVRKWAAFSEGVGTPWVLPREKYQIVEVI
jgi:hypothetical protein